MPEMGLEASVQEIRRIQWEEFDASERKNKEKAVDQACRTLVEAGPRGLKRLQMELQTLEKTGEKDDVFALLAASVLWKLGGISQSQAIARIWHAASLDVQYMNVFPTAVEAARTRDPRVLPMLKACLKDKRGRFVRPDKELDLQWPMTAKVIWGIYGTLGLPILEEILERSREEVEIQSAMLILTDAAYLPTLATIRGCARKIGLLRQSALISLGIFGHPEDFEILTSAALRGDPEVQWCAAYAFYEFEDLRAVPYLTRLLEVPQNDVQVEALQALGRFIVPASVETIRVFCDTPKRPQDKEFCMAYNAQLLKEMKPGWESYDAMTPPERERYLASLRARIADTHRIQPGDRKPDRTEILRALEVWRKEGRIAGGEYGWIQVKHLLSALRPADIALLWDVRASLLEQLSDASFVEAAMIGEAIKRLGRSRYRTNPWITERAEAPSSME